MAKLRLRRFYGPALAAAAIGGALALWGWLSAPAPTAAPSGEAVDPETAERLRLAALGPQTARDHLYCAGAIHAALTANAADGTGDPDARRNRLRALKLADAGVAVLLKEAPGPDSPSAIVDAHAEIARTDRAAGRLRLSRQDCLARADALGALEPAPMADQTAGSNP